MKALCSILISCCLIHASYAFYESQEGRWTSRDPIEEKGGENLYAFCSNSPMSNSDKLGRNVTLTTGNKNASLLQAWNRYFHQEICVDTWVWNKNSCCWRRTGRSCYSFGATGVGLGAPGDDWIGTDSIKGPGLIRGEVYWTGDQGIEDAEVLETSPCQDIAFGGYLDSLWLQEDTYSLFRHNCRTFSQAMMDKARNMTTTGGCQNDTKCE